MHIAVIGKRILPIEINSTADNVQIYSIKTNLRTFQLSWQLFFMLFKIFSYVWLLLINPYKSNYELFFSLSRIFVLIITYNQ